MLTHPCEASIPGHVVACLNRATDRAVKSLRREHFVPVQRRALRPHGASWLGHAASEATRHPEAPDELAFLETVLYDVMIEAVLKRFPDA